MAQQTFSGVPGAFSAGEVLSASDQELLRDFLIAQIKEGQTGDTGEILPMIMDLTNNRIVLDAGGLEFSNGSLQTIAGMTTAGGTFTGAITGIHNHEGEKVGDVSHTRNTEYIYVVGEEKYIEAVERVTTRPNILEFFK